MTDKHDKAFTRRAMLVGGTASGLLLQSELASRAVMAQPAAATTIFNVGEAQITVISDGMLQLPASFVLPGRETADVQKAFTDAGATFAGFRAEVNVTIVKTGRETMLIDTGGGPDFVPTLGRFYERMDAAGIKAQSITKVVFTHAHADHFWGVVDPLGGDTLFEAAEYVMTVAERDFWLKPDVADGVPDALRGMAIGTNRRLNALSARIKGVQPGSEIAAGVQLVDTAGHTPGHASVLVRSGGQQILIGGDVLSQNIISFSEPGWTWGPDMDSERAISSRRRVLDQLATDKTELLGYHLPWPGRGRVERQGTAYRFVASA